ncbi:hypothetical protein O9992_30815 [Vibrio lentus]|nr:hypothetical protein [Vibrio lentus]
MIKIGKNTIQMDIVYTSSETATRLELRWSERELLHLRMVSLCRKQLSLN